MVFIKNKQGWPLTLNMVNTGKGVCKNELHYSQYMMPIIFTSVEDAEKFISNHKEFFEIRPGTITQS